MTELLKYCPFCGDENVELKYRKGKLGTKTITLTYIECPHCAARGGSFSSDYDSDDAAAIRDWNQRGLRPETICHSVRRWFVQLEYDISSLYYKVRRWDW